MGEFFGQTFGFLKVIGGATEEQPQKVRCRCVCGNEKDILIKSLKYGQTKSCGCLRGRNRLIDLSGRKFGKLSVTERAPNRNKLPMWHCKCDCGDQTTVQGSNLRSGHTTSCGCKGGKFIDRTGKRFGRLTVLERAPSQGYTTKWECRCDCGTVKDVVGNTLVSGDTHSCGCLQRERTSEASSLDLVGQQYGRLLVLRRIQSTPVKWLCQCSCGSETQVLTTNLRNGNTQSCGCLQRERSSGACLIDLTGHRFGRLLVIRRSTRTARRTMWICECRCGKEAEVSTQSLRNAGTKSCGCLTSESASRRSGPNNPNWRPDLTEEERARKRNPHKNKLWRVAVYERDDFTCQICFQRGGKIEAHHLNSYSAFPDQRFDVDNGTTLCKGCHRRFHNKYGRRNNTVAQFQEFLELRRNRH
jgi:hypothetical protein